MTPEQTRQLGIEFERRVQTMIPETEFANKLDTETIYSYLNQYQDKFIHDIYKALDSVPTPSNPSAYVESILQGLLITYTKEVTKDSLLGYTVDLPDQFGLYLNSYTDVADSFNYKNDKAIPGSIPNVLISTTKANSFLQRPLDNMRIMRQPIAYFTNDGTKKLIRVMCDKYTTPKGFTMTYYKVPQYMDLMKSAWCELPMEAFEDIVSGAVDLYVQYVAGAEAKKKQLQEQAKKRAREDERDSRRSGGNQDEQQ